MAEEELTTVRLRAEFYKDGSRKIIIGLCLAVAAIIFLFSLSLFLHYTKPHPVFFRTDNEWRVLPPVPLDKPYQTNPDLLQWVSQAIPSSFTYDFLNYQSHIKDVSQYFTPKGFQNLLGQLQNNHADFTFLETNKIFILGNLSGAPFILNQGLIEGKYAWKIQIPLNLSYSNGNLRKVVIIAVVVRVPTLNNLFGVAIDDMSITEAQGNQVKTNV